MWFAVRTGDFVCAREPRSGGVICFFRIFALILEKVGIILHRESLIIYVRGKETPDETKARPVLRG
jgi:hypothetical protein